MIPVLLENSKKERWNKDSNTKAKTLINKTPIFNPTAHNFQSGTYLSAS